MKTLAQIAQCLDVPCPPDAEHVEITGLGMLHEATPTELSFLGSDKYVRQFKTSAALAVIANKKIKIPADHGKHLLLVDDADLAMAKVLAFFAPPAARPPTGIDIHAHIHPTATLGDNATIAQNAFIGANARIGARCVLHPNVYIGQETIVGDDCEIFPNVVIRERCHIGNRVIINAGAVIGTDGFGYRWDGTKHAKIPHIGTVIIEDDVEIGSATCIDRAKFSVTRVGRGSKIDNLVQVGHNVVIGPFCILCGQAGLAGSAILGTGVVMGGQSAMRDHSTMGDGATLAACSACMDDVPAKTIYSGIPAINHRQHLREQAAFHRLPELLTQFRKLSDQIEKLRDKFGLTEDAPVE